MEILERRIVNGLGLPYEFATGTLSWSGSSVSLRMLENLFINRRYLMLDILKFVVRVIAGLEGFDPNDVSVSLTEMRMADDIARQRLLIELANAGILPKSVLLREVGYDFDKMVDEMIRSEKREAEVKIEMAKINAAAQARISEAEATLNPELQFKASMIMRNLQSLPEELYSLPPSMINTIYYLMQMPIEEQQRILEELKATRPHIYNLIYKFLRSRSQAQAKAQSQAEAQSEELPEQKPPRRKEEKKQI